VTAAVTADLEAYNLSRPAETLRDFTWNELADWYLEVAKIEGDKAPMLSFVLDRLLRLWHPFVPFVTEEIYQRLFASGERDLLMVAAWPEAAEVSGADEIKGDFGVLQELVVAVRNIRATYKVEPGKTVDAVVHAGSSLDLIKRHEPVVRGLAKVADLRVESEGAAPEQSAAAVVSGIQVFVPLAGLVDLSAEKRKIEAELAEAEKYRTALTVKLENKDFVSRAPEAVVNAEKDKLSATIERINHLKEQLKALG
jgi:valyl-tRNA synthetase